MTMVVFGDNLAHMVVNGIFYSNFREQLDFFFSIFYDNHDPVKIMVVFRQNLTHVVVKWSPDLLPIPNVEYSS